MKNKILALSMAAAMALTALTGCGGESADNQGDAGSNSELKEFNVVYGSELSHINYMKSSLSTNTNFTANYVDGLITFDKYGKVIPCLAKTWDISDDGLTYTFHLRDDVNWYKNDGSVYAPVVAQDFVDSAKWIITKENASTTANLFYDVVKNAEKYFNGEITDMNEVGVKALDEHTVEYTLERPTPYFLKMTSYVCFLPANGQFIEECGGQFGRDAEMMLSNGAYILTEFEPEMKRTLEMNENYWDKENIHISRINYSYNKEAKTLAPELFLRGEVDEADIPAEILDEWMNDPEKSNMMVPKPASTTTNYYGFNFEPKYEEEFGPDNWLKAVNNENFRKSIYYALDRVAAVLTAYPYGAEEHVLRTITTRDFANVNGVDYTQLPALKEISDTDPFQPETAKEYKAKALEELEGKVTFPVTVVMPYSTGNQAGTNRVQVIKQQLEGVLGSDYITLELVPYPPTGFLKASRSSGKFSIMEMGWGPDYADPAGYTEIMTQTTSIGTKYSRPYLAEEYKDENGVSVYEKMLEDARNEVDIEARYNKFAEAEAFLIDHALVMPLMASGGGYRATKLDPFSVGNTQFNRSLDRYKGAVVLDKPMTQEEYKAAEAKYLEERAKALAAE